MDLSFKSKKSLDYINPRIILSYGVDFAWIMQNAYASESASEKVETTQNILNFKGIKDEVKVKFVGEIMTRPKSRRLAISRQLHKLLTTNTEEVLKMWDEYVI